jgi:hypothetical protein
MPTKDPAAAHPISEPHFRSKIALLLPGVVVAQVVGLAPQVAPAAG